MGYAMIKDGINCYAFGENNMDNDARLIAFHPMLVQGAWHDINVKNPLQYQSIIIKH